MNAASAGIRRCPGLRTLALGLLCLTACSGPPPPLPAAERLQQALGCPPAATTTPEAARPAVDLYVDASASMRGFVARGSTYMRVMEDLLGRMTSAGYAVRPNALCDDACRREVALGSAVADPRLIYSPSFYRGQRTPLAQLLTQLAAEPRQGLTILVSDLEQSSGSVDQRALVAALRRLAERTPQLLLLSFQGAFPAQGRARDDGRRRGAASRRFYLLVIAPSGPALGELDRRVLRHLPAQERFQPTQTPLTVRELRLGPQGADPPWGLFRRPEARACGAGGAWLASFVELRPIRDGEPLRLRLGGDFGAALESPAELQYEVRRLPGARLQAGQLAVGKPEAPAWRPAASRPVKAKDKDGEDGLLLSVPAPRPERGAWDLYRIRVRSGGGNLAVPRWAEEATGDVSEGKTPQLAHLVRAMQQAITEEVVFLDLLLALGRGA